MPESRQRVIERLESAVTELGDIADRLTLVGGCLTPLLITDPAAPPPRPTMDVDLVVELTTALEYDRLSRKMRRRGFQPGGEPDDPICRFRKGAITIDLLPTSPDVLGFGNRWYPLAAPDELRIWVRAELAEMARNRGFTDSLYGMVPGHGDVAGRVAIVSARFDQLATG